VPLGGYLPDFCVALDESEQNKTKVFNDARPRQNQKYEQFKSIALILSETLALYKLFT